MSQIVKMIEMKKLINLLNKASSEYYNSGESSLTDIEFDQKFKELQDLEKETGIVLSNSPTHKVGAKILTELQEIKHNHPMLSLDKCHTADEIIKFSNHRNDLIAMTKADGLTISIKYIDGELVSAETRGDGYVGSDCTEHIKHFLNVPLHINMEGTYIIDGEAIIYQNDFELINKNGKYKNPRNTAAGSLSVLDTNIVKERRLSFLAWDVIEGGKYNSIYKNLKEAVIIGFTTVPAIDGVDKIINVDDCNRDILNVSKAMGIPCDGVVWKFDDIEYGKSLGKTEHHFNNGIAWKPEKVEEETQLLDIEWTMGKTGILTPIAVFKAVELDGTTVERASLHNISVMKDLLGEHPYKGQKIKVYKANMIIPQISWGDKNILLDDTIIKIPTICPICKQEVQIIKENSTEVLKCVNPNCSGKLLGRLNHFVSKGCMNIDGLSEATLSFLIDMGWVNSYIDLYTLHKHSDYIDKWKNTTGFGIKSVDKILKSIEDSRNTTLERVIDAISIPLIGTKAAKDVSKFFNGDVHAFIESITEDPSILKQIDGFGEKMILEIRKWIKSPSSGDFLDLIGQLNIKKTTEENKINSQIAGKTFVITGSLSIYKNRDELVSILEKAGAKVVGSVSKKTNYLINNDNTSNSSKNVKARELNIPILTEEQIYNMLKGE